MYVSCYLFVSFVSPHHQWTLYPKQDEKNSCLCVTQPIIPLCNPVK